jgi:CheY-like chemotaxis protein
VTDTGGSFFRGSVVGDLRHEFRTPVNHIVGYAEMLLEDLDGDATSPEPEQTALKNILAAARSVLDAINAALPPTRAEVSRSELGALADTLRGPQGIITAATDDLLSGRRGQTDQGFASDVEKIRQAADRLLDVRAPATTPSTTPPSTPRPAATSPGLSQLGAGARVLVVDDDAENRDVLRRRLEREGCAVETAAAGQDALVMVKTNPYDLIMLDLLMPGMDGYTVLGHLKDDASTHDIPVIMISALDDLASIAQCIERGAEDYLPKPFDPVLLRARLHASLEKKRLRDAETEYLREVSRVISVARAVESGTYEPDALAEVARREDELGRLARVVDRMAAGVRARETRLKSQLEDLQREIRSVRESTVHETTILDGTKLAAGDRFSDRYEIVALIGAGGMGTVYRARDLELDEDVAIKTLLPELMADDEVIERFKSEIRLARRITHRHVVRSHDFGEWGGVYFLTMEYVEGLTVRNLLDQRGRLEISSTLAIARQLFDSLAVAHEAGVIHRDIKPQNLLLDAAGDLKVMDFGVARLAERTSGVTEVGMAIGTPSYMPPEQLLGDDIDARADLYAVGVVLYECLTGRLPFEAKSAISLVAKVLSEEPAVPQALNAEVPPLLSSLIMRLLAKKAADRYGSAAEVASALEQIS